MGLDFWMIALVPQRYLVTPLAFSQQSDDDLGTLA